MFVRGRKGALGQTPFVASLPSTPIRVVFKLNGYAPLSKRVAGDAAVDVTLKPASKAPKKEGDLLDPFGGP